MKLIGKPKVLISSVPESAGGGIVSLHKILLNGAGIQAYDLNLFQFSSPNPFEENFVQRIVRIIRYTLKIFYLLIKDKNFKLIHINTAADTKAILRDLVLVIAGKIFRKKILLQLHGKYGDYENSAFVDRLFWGMLKLSNLIIVLSLDDKKRLLSLCPSVSIEILPNFIKNDDFRNMQTPDISPTDHRTRILFLSRFIKEKGVYELIDAIPKVVTRFPDTLFIFAGDGPEIDLMKKKCHKNRIESFTNFTGWLNYRQTLDALLGADIFVLPSYTEAMPMVILQALAAGLPIVATAVGGIKDIIKDGENGFLIQPKSIDSISDKLQKLIPDGELRAKIKSNNLGLAADKFDVGVVSKRLETFYTETITGRRS